MPGSSLHEHLVQNSAKDWVCPAGLWHSLSMQLSSLPVLVPENSTQLFLPGLRALYPHVRETIGFVWFPLHVPCLKTDLRLQFWASMGLISLFPVFQGSPFFIVWHPLSRESLFHIFCLIFCPIFDCFRLVGKSHPYYSLLTSSKGLEVWKTHTKLVLD